MTADTIALKAEPCNGRNRQEQKGTSVGKSACAGAALSAASLHTANPLTAEEEVAFRTNVSDSSCVLFLCCCGGLGVIV